MHGINSNFELISQSVVKMKQVCIVGAGTAGLCAARRSLEEGFSVTIYEQTNNVGGTWVYTDQIGTDEYGIDVHSSMYQGLRTNLPKEVMGYPDFNIKPSEEESYVSSQVIEEFLNDYCKEHKLLKHIKFLHYVIRISPTRNCQWQVGFCFFNDLFSLSFGFAVVFIFNF